jgi:hypothetical protein
LDTANVWVKIDGEWSLEANFSTGVSLASNAVPQAPSVAGAPGVNSLLSRDDHSHPQGVQQAQGTLAAAINGFRLAPTADDSIPADGSFSTVYLAPVTGDQIGLYDIALGTWRLFTPAALSYTLAGRTAGLPFDLFAYQVAGVVSLEAVNWTQPTPGVRATGIVKQNGIWVKSGDVSRRYLGTVRPRSATTYRVQRFNAVSTGSVGIDYFNENLRKQTAIQLTDTVANQAYSSTVWRQWAASANAQIDTITGLPGDPVSITAMASANTSNTTTTISFPLIGIGINNATPVGARTMEGISRVASAPFDMATISASLAVNSTLGVTAYWWLQYGSGNVEFFGINGPAQSGMMALVSY